MAMELPHGSASNSGPLPDPVVLVIMNHNPIDWSAQEQAILEEGLNTTAQLVAASVVHALTSDHIKSGSPNPKRLAQQSSLVCYAKIAARLPNKTVRDVALRVQWRKKQLEINRKRQEDYEVARRSKDKMVFSEKYSKRRADSGVDHKREIVMDPSGKSTQLEVPSPSLSTYAQVLATPNGELLQRNAMALLHLDVKINSYHKTHTNLPLFTQVRENILKVMNNMGEMPEELKHYFPPLESLNEKLFNEVTNATPPSIM